MLLIVSVKSFLLHMVFIEKADVAQLLAFFPQCCIALLRAMESVITSHTL